MKRILLAMCMLGAGASADVNVTRVMSKITHDVINVAVLGHFTPGDTCAYNLSISGMSGTMNMSIKSVDSTGVWIDQNIAIMGQTMDSQTLIDPATGAIKKVIVNGQEQAPPDPNDVQIISENKASVTVPAGSFPNCIDVKAHIKSQNTDEEMFIDPTNVPVAGLVKLSTTAQGMPVTGELTKITHGTPSN